MSSAACPPPPPKPPWLKTKLAGGAAYFEVKRNLRSRKLVTVCEEAKCPNIGECWSTRTATFMVLGDTCTRACRFCNVKTGNPQGQLPTSEPDDVADSTQAMNLNYVVLTMVDRDDLPDGGAAHVAAVIQRIFAKNPHIQVELLAGDFAGELAATTQLSALPLAVYAHNLETVRRLSPRVRDRRASYATSLAILHQASLAKRTRQPPAHNSATPAPPLLTKSALMLGLGEREDEVIATMKDLREVDCDMITLGQYMRPSKRHLPIKQWVTPATFARYGQIAQDLGFTGVMSTPLSRSSYMAGTLYATASQRRQRSINESQKTLQLPATP